MSRTKPTRSNKALHVGAKVWLNLGERTLTATVVEDRGQIGVGGRRIVRVRVMFDPADEAREFEVPAEDLRSAA